MLDPTPTAQFLASLADTSMMVRSVLRGTRTRLAVQRGLTLVEMMVTVSVLVVVLLATFAVLDGSRKVASKEQQRSDSIREARTGLQRMAKELRLAYGIQSATANSISFYVRCATGETCTSGGIRARSKLIAYTCGTTCVRGESITPVSAGGPCCTSPTANEEMVSRVLNSSETCSLPFPADSSAPGPIFRYRTRNVVTGGLADECSPTEPNAVDITLRIPAAGEKSNQGYVRSVIIRDAVYLRNLDL